MTKKLRTGTYVEVNGHAGIIIKKRLGNNIGMQDFVRELIEFKKQKARELENEEDKLLHEFYDMVEEAQPKCECGATFTSFKNHHLDWCPIRGQDEKI